MGPICLCLTSLCEGVFDGMGFGNLPRCLKISEWFVSGCLVRSCVAEDATRPDHKPVHRLLDVTRLGYVRQLANNTSM